MTVMVVDTQQIRAAKAGNATHLGELIESFRHFLNLLAKMQLGPKLQEKTDESDWCRKHS
jgi:hypothetical protein